MTTISRGVAAEQMARYSGMASEPSTEAPPPAEAPEAPAEPTRLTEARAHLHRLRDEVSRWAGMTEHQALQSAGVPPMTGHDPTVRAAMAAPVRSMSPIDIVNHQTAIAQAHQSEMAHVGLLDALDLPGAYKTARASEFSVPPESGRVVSEKLKANPQALAVLQRQADRGLEAARDMHERGLTKDQLFAQNPQLANAYANDPAFHEGFDAYEFTARSSQGDLAAIHARLDRHASDNHRALVQLSLRA